MMSLGTTHSDFPRLFKVAYHYNKVIDTTQTQRDANAASVFPHADNFS